MSTALSKSVLRAALLHNEQAVEGAKFRAYQYESFTAFRVLVRLENGSETDVVYDKITECFRVWQDGMELGDPGMN